MKSLLSRDSKSSTSEPASETPTSSERKKSPPCGTAFSSQPASPADEEARKKKSKNFEYLWKTNFATALVVNDNETEQQAGGDLELDLSKNQDDDTDG